MYNDEIANEVLYCESQDLNEGKDEFVCCRCGRSCSKDKEVKRSICNDCFEEIFEDYE